MQESVFGVWIWSQLLWKPYIYLEFRDRSSQPVYDVVSTVCFMMAFLSFYSQLNLSARHLNECYKLFSSLYVEGSRNVTNLFVLIQNWSCIGHSTGVSNLLFSLSGAIIPGSASATLVPIAEITFGSNAINDEVCLLDSSIISSPDGISLSYTIVQPDCVILGGMDEPQGPEVPIVLDLEDKLSSVEWAHDYEAKKIGKLLYERMGPFPLYVSFQFLMYLCMYFYWNESVLNM